MSRTQPFHHTVGSTVVRLAVVVALVAALVAVTPPEPARAAPSSGTVSFALGSSLAPEGTTPHQVVVTLDVGAGNTLDAGFSVDVVLGAPGSATAGTDFTFSTATVSFATDDPDGAIRTVNVAITPDVFDEVDETFNLSLDNIVGGTSTIGSPSGHQVTITDDDPPPSLSISNAASVAEGATASFAVTLSPASGKTVTVDYATANGTAVAPGDYTAKSGTLTFVPGDTSETITVATNTDGSVELTENFTVQLSGETNASISDGSGLGTITDSSPLPSLSISDAAPVTEGATASFTVTLSPASANTVTVNYATANGTAVAPGDYDAISTTLLTYTPGQTTKTIDVSTNDDGLDEPDGETFTVGLSGVSNATISDGSGAGSINDNDPLPTVSVLDASALEGAGTMTFTVNLSAASGKTITVNYATSNGTAIAPGDYTTTTGTLTFVPGDTSESILVPIVPDLLDEGVSEAFTVTLSLPSNVTLADATATGTITDDDDPPVVSVNSISVEEGIAAGFTISLSAVSALPVTVSYATVNGTAVAPGDFTAIPVTPVTFLPGETTKPVTVTTINDTLNEATETYIVRLSGVVNGTTPVTDGTGTILDNDGAPGLSVVDPPSAALESAGTLVFTVALLPASGQAVSVTYTTANGTATAPGDYTATTGTLVFTPGQTTKTVPVPIVNDTLDEVTETLSLVLSAPVNTTLVDATGIGLIADNDNVAPVVNVVTTNASGTPEFQFTTNQIVTAKVSFTDPGVADSHSAIIDWGDGTQSTLTVSPLGTRVFERTHAYGSEGIYIISVNVTDVDKGAGTDTSAVTIEGIGPVGGGGADTVGLVDPTQGHWKLYDSTGTLAAQFFFGNPGDYPIYGDWNCDGIETPGMYRQSDGYVYLRNTNTQGAGDIRFFFGNPGDVPIAGDFNGDGCDTVSIYRPSVQTFFIINKLGANDGGLGAADFSYVFGNPGDKPFVGDFDGNGTETVGLHRESTGLVYFRNSHTQGNADNQFIFGDPGDRLVAGDWTGDSIFSPALFRPSTTTMYFRYTNTQGVADAEWVAGSSSWLPVSGKMGLG
jgi:hypothetical protein